MKIISLIKKYEKRIVIAVSLVLWGALSYYLYYHQIGNSVGDTTFATQILYNFKHTLAMESTFALSIVKSIDHIWGQSAEYVCNQPLNLELTKVPWGHFYFVMYLIAPLAKIMSIPLLIAILQGGIYASVLIFTYLMSRKNKISIVNAALFTALISQHPLWLSGMEGQFYFNRFFLPFAGLILLILHEKKINYPFLFLASVLAASTTEIYGVSIFIMMLSYLWIYRQKNIKIFLMGLLFLAISFISIIYIQQTFGMNSTQVGFFNKTFGHGIHTAINSIVANLKDPKTLIYLSVNMVFVGVFAFQNLRLLFPLLLILAPNIIVNLGGVEKIGWSTHYHISYFIPLIWIGILGLKKFKLKNTSLSLLLIAVITLTAYVNPLDLSKNTKPYLAVMSLFNKINFYRQYGQYQLDFRDDLRAAVGDSSVSAPEAIVYNLYDHDIYYYPVNIDQVDKAIFRYDGSKKGEKRFYSINYGHQDPDLDSCIIERMGQNGFNFEEPVLINGWAVITKK